MKISGKNNSRPVRGGRRRRRPSRHTSARRDASGARASGRRLPQFFCVHLISRHASGAADARDGANGEIRRHPRGDASRRDRPRRSTGTRGGRAGAQASPAQAGAAVNGTSEEEFNAYIKNVNARIEHALDLSVPMHYPERLSESMRYSLLAGGKESARRCVWRRANSWVETWRRRCRRRARWR